VTFSMRGRLADRRKTRHSRQLAMTLDRYGFAGNWPTDAGPFYVGDFDKYIHVLYVFANKHTCIVYFS
jgi:hypothetical protein